ncbi:uncharacterized protein Tco025E_01499 [Trypanosoma conorhini]|uniref:C3H1-type domain-containing protein n=1 Tax=Trypanosoma conorhini TaxID=83891 RepID=A0A3R7NSD5_9TRYP|nr:uncharacterized protein Tco025E_01499 [Trypanosoma conorhini]RNF26332.1 hypothetical protein Tco025E_01499 [Trypanosoma conorhini]
MTQIITDNLRPSVPSAAPKSQRVCRHFARGRCTWGSSCRFSHDAERVVVDESQIGQNFIGPQQLQLQKERHVILKAALNGEFEIKPYSVAEGYQRHIVHLRFSSSTILLPRLLTEEALQQQLIELGDNEQLRIGGLLFLVGEPAVFWSMMQNYCLRGTTTSSKWDTLLANAKRGYVECMFFRSAVGCLSSECPFSHTTPPAVTLATPLQNMATNNALLTPLLGFGMATTATAVNTTSPAVASVAKTHTNGLCQTTESARQVSVPSLTVKADESVAFRDTVWGACGIPELKTTPEAQEDLSFIWGGGVRSVPEFEW